MTERRSDAPFLVHEQTNAKLEGFLQQLGYTYVEETDNMVYRSFLAADAT